MKADDSISLPVTIGDQTFRISAAPGEEDRCRRAAESANAAYEDIRRQGMIGGPRAMAMAAFQLAMELEEAREALSRTEQSRDRLGQLIHRIDEATKK